jgi:hypothetical protein
MQFDACSVSCCGIQVWEKAFTFGRATTPVMLQADVEEYRLYSTYVYGSCTRIAYDTEVGSIMDTRRWMGRSPHGEWPIIVRRDNNSGGPIDILALATTSALFCGT